MQSNEESRPAPKLKVVPPNKIAPPTDSTTPSPPLPPSPKPTSSETSNHPLGRRILIGMVAAGFILGGFIKTPFEVGGTVRLEMPEGAREIVRISRSAMVMEMLVKPGDYVKKGAELAKLSSLDLKKEITDTETRLNESRQVLDATQKKSFNAQSQLIEVRARAEAAYLKANQSGGKYTARIETLNLDYQGLISRLPDLENDFNNRQQGFIARAVSRKDFNEARDQLHNLRTAIENKDGEIKYTRQLQLDEANDVENQRKIAQSSLEASSLIAAIESNMDAQKKTIADLEKHLAELKSSENNLTVLTSPIEGVIITSDLDLKKNQQLKPGDEFLRIADLRHLTGTVEIREEDSTYVDQNQSVTFRPRQDKVRSYDAKVVDNLLEIKNEPTTSNGMLQVRILVDNNDGKLKVGTNGYAKIFSEEISLYEHFGRELMRLIPLERLLWGKRNHQ